MHWFKAQILWNMMVINMKLWKGFPILVYYFANFYFKLMTTNLL